MKQPEQAYDEQPQAPPPMADEIHFPSLTPQIPTSPAEMIENHKRIIAQTEVVEAGLNSSVSELQALDLYAECESDLLQSLEGIRTYKVEHEKALQAWEQLARIKVQPPNLEMLQMESKADPRMYAHGSRVADWLWKVD